MVSGIFNHGYSTSYFLRPLSKEHNGMKVECADKNAPHTPDWITNNLEEIKQIDQNKDYMITLNELKAFQFKSDLMESITNELDAFNTKRF
ncbi:hypothetical protein IKE67_00205 [bacterium]|nr:hypothetical protein [bacterium]